MPNRIRLFYSTNFPTLKPIVNMNNNTTHLKRSPSIIETERLLIRTPRIEDAFSLRDLAASDPAFAHATVGQSTSTLDAACTAIYRMLEDHRKGLGSWWIVEKKQDGRVIGITGYSARHTGSGPLSALATDVIGNGYAKEVIEALILSSSPLPRLHDSFSDSEIEDIEPAHNPPTRWYWQNKPNRSTRLRCA